MSRDDHFGEEFKKEALHKNSEIRRRMAQRLGLRINEGTQSCFFLLTFLGLAEDFAPPSPSPSSPKPVPLPQAMVEPSAATTVWVFPQARAWISQPWSSYSGLGYMALSLVGFMRPAVIDTRKINEGVSSQTKHKREHTTNLRTEARLKFRSFRSLKKWAISTTCTPDKSAHSLPLLVSLTPYVQDAASGGASRRVVDAPAHAARPRVAARHAAEQKVGEGLGGVNVGLVHVAQPPVAPAAPGEGSAVRLQRHRVVRPARHLHHVGEPWHADGVALRFVGHLDGRR